MVKLWLDDVRPAPDGWVWVKTVQAAILVVLKHRGEIDEMSLDHDLGACPTCLGGKTADEWLMDHDMKSMPNCDHFGTGYTFVCWMEENNMWPDKKPRVHSANPAGRRRMELAIERHY